MQPSAKVPPEGLHPDARHLVWPPRDERVASRLELLRRGEQLRINFFTGRAFAGNSYVRCASRGDDNDGPSVTTVCNPCRRFSGSFHFFFHFFFFFFFFFLSLLFLSFFSSSPPRSHSYDSLRFLAFLCLCLGVQTPPPPQSDGAITPDQVLRGRQIRDKEEPASGPPARAQKDSAPGRQGPLDGHAAAISNCSGGHRRSSIGRVGQRQQALTMDLR
ncbi:uncharacterized protein BJX67DRAFT_167935 [Aspergillus lucknowensis]|uniref:Uncharacterized protein n=1 Tax=Aspergillus lucknowensis TaxID=176173 RepID=A0ABR4M589_9EURO